ncbi:enoyl-CoA hydratase [Ochrobactrum sp. XJ1]|nr:enoyl-CoA hydratase [Ochrobactrum sp. XJ1]
MSSPFLLHDVIDHVAVLTLNRPDKLNALTFELYADLRDAIMQAQGNPEVRAILLTGAGRGFCAGADMRALESATKTAGDEKHGVPGPSGDTMTMSYLPAIRKPIIAAVNGVAVGLGFVLAMFADVRFSSESAMFMTSFATRGLVAEDGISWLLPKVIGHSKAMDLLLSGRAVRGEEALSMGLVSRVLKDDELFDHALDYARSMAKNCSPRSMDIIKRQVWNDHEKSYSGSVDVSIALLHEAFTTDDFKEGVQHHLERRPANFQGLMV